MLIEQSTESSDPAGSRTILSSGAGLNNTRAYIGWLVACSVALGQGET